MLEDIDIISYGPICTKLNCHYKGFKSMFDNTKHHPNPRNILIVLGEVTEGTEKLLNEGFHSSFHIKKYLRCGTIKNEAGIVDNSHGFFTDYKYNEKKDINILVSIANTKYEIKRIIDYITPYDRYYFITTIEHEVKSIDCYKTPIQYKKQATKSVKNYDFILAEDAINMMMELYGYDIGRNIYILHMRNTWGFNGVQCNICWNIIGVDEPIHNCHTIAYGRVTEFCFKVIEASSWFINNPISGQDLLVGYSLNNNSKNK
jgi:hypothetical protein